ncbi:unnamed protein product [Soboliphyme baturini]|uniref:G_PROTEIN_RECEP_F2_3 domain-containing protein n=1 Tax=Soboliphyme baturini TaxID=241478 RepID=A0A183IGR6_9BILA|nr:unnamed protein product [Soboliphyme baturini]
MFTTKLLYNIASSYEECMSALNATGQPIYVGESGGTRWCNATWDSILCWPAIPGNSSYSLPCPPMKGLVIENSPERQPVEVKNCRRRFGGPRTNTLGGPDGQVSCSVAFMAQP